MERPPQAHHSLLVLLAEGLLRIVVPGQLVSKLDNLLTQTSF